MGDVGDFYREWDAMKKAAKENRLHLAQMLDAQLAPGWKRHTPYHWYRDLCGSKMDYWPSTGKWQWRGKMYRGTPYATTRFIVNRENEHEQGRAA